MILGSLKCPSISISPQRSCYSGLILWVIPTAGIPRAALKISMTGRQRDSDKETTTWGPAEAPVRFNNYFQVTERQVPFQKSAKN